MTTDVVAGPGQGACRLAVGGADAGAGAAVVDIVDAADGVVEGLQCIGWSWMTATGGLHSQHAIAVVGGGEAG